MQGGLKVFWWLFYVILTGFHGGSMGTDGDVMVIEICHNISPGLCPASKKKKTKSYGSTLGRQWTHRCVTVNLTPCTLWRYIHSWPIWNLKKKNQSSPSPQSPPSSTKHKKKRSSGASPAIPLSVAEGLHADPFPKTGDGIQRRQGRSFTFAHFAHLPSGAGSGGSENIG